MAALLARQITGANAPERRRRQWLAAAGTIAGRRIDAVVSNKHRHAYQRAASLTVAFAEALTLSGAGDGWDHIAGIRQRYPRHTAFRGELGQAASTSTLLATTEPSQPPPAPTVGRRPGRRRS